MVAGICIMLLAIVIDRITQAMVRLSRHDTTTVIPSRNDRDEVGEMARAVEVFKDNHTGYLVYVCETGAIAILPRK